MRILAYFCCIALGWFAGIIWASRSWPSPLEFATLALLFAFATYAIYSDHVDTRLRLWRERTGADEEPPRTSR